MKTNSTFLYEGSMFRSFRPGLLILNRVYGRIRIVKNCNLSFRILRHWIVPSLDQISYYFKCFFNYTSRCIEALIEKHLRANFL